MIELQFANGWSTSSSQDYCGWSHREIASDLAKASDEPDEAEVVLVDVQFVKKRKNSRCGTPVRTEIARFTLGDLRKAAARPRRKYVIDCGYAAVAEWRIVPTGLGTWMTLDDESYSFDEAVQTLSDALDTEIQNAQASKKILLACKTFDEYAAKVGQEVFIQRNHDLIRITTAGDNV